MRQLDASCFLHLRNILIISGLLFSNSIFSQQNVFDIASKFPGSNLVVAKDPKLATTLSGILWYTGIEDFEQMDLLDSLVKHYPVLKEKLKDFQTNMFSDVIAQIFNLNLSAIQHLPNSLPDKERLLRAFKNFKASENILSTSSIEKAEAEVNRLNDLIFQKTADPTIMEDSTRLAEDFRVASFRLARLDSAKNSMEKEASIITTLIRSSPKLITAISTLLNPDSLYNTNKINFPKNSVTEAFKIILNNREQMETVTEVTKQFPSIQTFESQLINEVAIFLVNRVKQETILWFYDRISNNNTWNSLARNFFPETKKLLESKEATEVPNLGIKWRYALSKDFATMPENVLLADSLWFKIDPAKRFYREYIRTVIEMSKLLVQKYNYSELLSSMYQKTKLNSSLQSFNDISAHDMITLLYILDREFVYKTDERNELKTIPLTFESLQSYTTKEFIIALSLLDIKYEKIFTRLLKVNPAHFDFGKAQVDQLKAWIGRLQLASSELEKIRTKYNDIIEDGKSTQVLEFSNDIWNAYSILLKSFSVGGYDSSHLFARFNSITKVISYATSCQEIYRQIQNKNFPGAVSTLLTVMDSLRLDGRSKFTFKKQDILDGKAGFINTSKLSQELQVYFNDIKRYNPKLQNLGINVTGDNIELSTDGFGALLILKDEKKTYQNILKLASFLSDISSSKGDDKRLAKIIESYAMPPQSYKRKRNSWSSWDLNAYVGVYSGYETIVTTQNQADKEGGFVYGISAPIGISWSTTKGRDLLTNVNKAKKNLSTIKFGNKIKYKSESTTSVTLSFIDLGAVVSYRFTNMDSSLPQEAKWRQLVSPGLHIQRGIRSTPLVISFSVQYTPSLRRFQENIVEKELRQYNALRFSAGVYFDLPLFNFTSKD